MIPRKLQGRCIDATPEQRLRAIVQMNLACQAIAKATPYGVDAGKLLSEICGALIDLGFEAESAEGGFGRPPTLILKGENGDRSRRS